MKLLRIGFGLIILVACWPIVLGVLGDLIKITWASMGITGQLVVLAFLAMVAFVLFRLTVKFFRWIIR